MWNLIAMFGERVVTRPTARQECLVHILIPSYGRAEYLRETVQSIVNELGRFGDHPTMRVTVVDDGSPTSDIAEIAGEFRTVAYVRNNRNLGVVGNFNRCLEISEGRYTVFMGSDDLLSPGYLEQVVLAIGEFRSPTVICPSVSVIDASSQPSNPLGDRVKRMIMPRASRRIRSGAREFACVESSGDRAVARLMMGDYVYFPALAWNTEALRSVGFCATAGVATDLFALSRCLLAGGTLVTFRSTPAVFRYRRHPESVSSVAARAGTQVGEERWVHEQVGRIARRQGWGLTRAAACLRPTSRLHAWSVRIGASRFGNALATMALSSGCKACGPESADRS